MSVINEHIKNYKIKGIHYLESLNENELSELIMSLNDNYYNGKLNSKKMFLNDNDYDLIKEYTENKYPSNKTLKHIGSKITDKNKIKLPYFMGSLDKIKFDKLNVVENWLRKYSGPYVITPKIDGVSGLYIYKNGTQQLMTRGDGYFGQDVSRLIPHLKFPKNEENVVIRGEFIMSKNIFEKKYKNYFSNPRNLVSGIINSKQIDNKIHDIIFIGYEVIAPILIPSKQMELLKNMDINCVNYILTDKITKEYLSETLLNVKNQLHYEIDGLVITNNKIYERINENPKHSFAFKMLSEQQTVEGKVIDVIWNPSKDGYLKPQIQIEPVTIGGVEINYTTGFNASYIYNNKIGKNTILKLVRSGDVIPHIVEVLVSSEFPQMPENLPYIWNETNVDIILNDKENNNEVKEKNITLFFRGLKIDGISTGLVKKLIENGYDTIIKILGMEIKDYIGISGFQEKLSNKIYNNIKERLKNVSLVELMVSSNIFGRGISTKKIEPIMLEYPNILISKESYQAKIEKIAKIKGFSTKTAELFVLSIPKFLEFLKQINSKISDNILNPNPLQTNNNNNNDSNDSNDSNDNDNNNESKCSDNGEKQKLLKGKTIVMSGFRNINLSSQLKKIDCKEGTKINSKTFMLIIKNNSEYDNMTVKMSEAIKNNIPILKLDEFVEYYGLTV